MGGPACWWFQLPHRASHHICRVQSDREQLERHRLVGSQDDGRIYVECALRRHPAGQ